MTPQALLLLLLALQAKHFAGDYLLQSARMVRCKGIYGNLVGISHSAIHAALTLGVLLVVAPVSMALASGIAVVEFAVHYHTDWAKEQLTGRAGYTVEDRGYWVTLGLDQFVHQATYVVIVYAVVSAA
ncbi:MAG: DUF3307 domain-containing protein [Pseudomonadota bacterium]